MLKAFPHHTPFATLAPDSPTAHNDKIPSLSELYCEMALASASPNPARKHSVRLLEV